jgi:hypothetical protein
LLGRYKLAFKKKNKYLDALHMKMRYENLNKRPSFCRAAGEQSVCSQ